ncbi:type II secretion system F family protein [Chloroflexota bacterium]
MSLLLEAGVSLPSIMSSVVGTVTNRVLRKALVEVRQKLVQGQGLSQPMAEIGLFPELLVQMVVIGEKTGSLPSSLASVSDLYERKIEQEVRTLISLIQNILLVIIAIVVGFIGISMITPLYSMLGAVH